MPISDVGVTLCSCVFQELCMLLDDYWERMNLTVPIYFSAGICCFLKVEALSFFYFSALCEVMFVDMFYRFNHSS